MRGTQKEISFPNALRQVVDLFAERSKEEVLRDVRTASKKERPGIITAYLMNIDQVLTESFDTGEWFTNIIDLRNKLQEEAPKNKQAVLGRAV